MQITINAGGRTWIVEEGNLLGWLRANAVQKDHQLKEVVQDQPYDKDVRILLRENG